MQLVRLSVAALSCAIGAACATTVVVGRPLDADARDQVNDAVGDRRATLTTTEDPVPREVSAVHVGPALTNFVERAADGPERPAAVPTAALSEIAGFFGALLGAPIGLAGGGIMGHRTKVFFDGPARGRTGPVVDQPCLGGERGARARDASGALLECKLASFHGGPPALYWQRIEPQR